jgi:hypothetical protein
VVIAQMRDAEKVADPYFRELYRTLKANPKVTNADRLSNSAFDTGSPAILIFTGDDSGRTVYLALRWENTRGEKGPWSDIAIVTVP